MAKGWTRRTDSGRWMARYTAPNGRTYSKVFDVKADAERWTRNELAKADKGEWIDPAAKRTTFGEWLPRWEATRTNLSPATVAQQSSLLANHVVPWWEDWPLGAVTPTDVQAFVADLEAKGLGAWTVHHCYAIVRQVFESAADAGIIARSPARGVGLPRLPDQEMRFLAPDEVDQLANSAGDYSALILTAAYTGLRWGELAGLRIDRLDLLRRRLTVTQALSEVRGRVTLKAPKTAASRRTVALPRFLVDVLAGYLTAKPPGEDGFVFQSPNGGPLRRSNFRRRVWLPAVAASVGEPMRFHDLRHSHVALLIAQGEHPKTIQTRLGHAKISTTLDTYGHLFEGLDEAAADTLDANYAHFPRTLAPEPVVSLDSRTAKNPR